MSRRGNCWDNASQESFFGHMKDECDLSGCSTPEEVKEMIDNYVYYYNNERPQWTRNKMTPTEYEEYLNSLSDNEYSDYLQNEQEKYDKMMKKAREKALKRALMKFFCQRAAFKFKLVFYNAGKFFCVIFYNFRSCHCHRCRGTDSVK